MMKKMFVLVLVCTLLLCSVSQAFATSQRYCSTCNKVTTFGQICSKSFSRNGAYQQHRPNNTVCNYYNSYADTNEICTVCGNIFVSEHLHTIIHTQCSIGGQYVCPF